MITPARTRTPPPSERDPMPDSPDEHAALRDAVRSLCLVAPISTNLILAHVAEHVLGLPRSF